MKTNLKTWIFFSALILMNISCRSDSQENPRAYVEGKLVSATVNYDVFRLKIVSENVVVAETMLESGGNFKLSGPISNSGFAIRSTDKIKSFSADKTGLTLSADALQINVPKEITYINFNEIALEK